MTSRRSIVRVTQHPLFSKLWIVRERDGSEWARWTHPPYGTHLEAMNVAHSIVAQRRIESFRALFSNVQAVDHGD